MAWQVSSPRCCWPDVLQMGSSSADNRVDRCNSFVFNEARLTDCLLSEAGPLPTGPRRHPHPDPVGSCEAPPDLSLGPPPPYARAPNSIRYRYYAVSGRICKSFRIRAGMGVVHGRVTLKKCRPITSLGAQGFQTRKKADGSGAEAFGIALVPPARRLAAGRVGGRRSDAHCLPRGS